MRLVDRIYRAIIGFIFILLGRGDFKPHTNLAGDREIERGWILTNLGVGPGKVLDFGSGGYGGLSLAAAMAGFTVTAVDLNAIKWHYMDTKINFVQADLLKQHFPENDFDIIIGCSVVEHIGLMGRYENQPNISDGDLGVMTKIRSWIKPKGKVLLTIPVGKEGIYRPHHRVYGSNRLSKLLTGFKIVKQDYWQKETHLWQRVTKKQALSASSSAKEYALGLFVLTKR